MVASKSFVGLSPMGWKIVAVDNEETSPASNAIDGDPATPWQTGTNDTATLPHSLTVDTGAERRIAGFTYLPRQDGRHDGVVDTYRFETSTDGKNWTTNVNSWR
jgi:alpha-L-fucosidase